MNDEPKSTPRANEIPVMIEIPMHVLLYNSLLSLLVRVVIGFSYAVGALLAAKIAGAI